MVISSLLGRVFTLCLVYVPNIKQGTFLVGFIFVLPSSKILTTDLNFTVGLQLIFQTLKLRSCIHQVHS